MTKALRIGFHLLVIAAAVYAVVATPGGQLYLVCVGVAGGTAIYHTCASIKEWWGL